MCKLYSELSTSAYNLGLRMWKFPPKIHLFAHLVEYMVLYQGNPKYYWTYQDEDLVGAMLELCQTVHVSTLAMSAMFKWVHSSFP